MKTYIKDTLGHYGLGFDYRLGGYLRLWFWRWIIVIELYKDGMKLIKIGKDEGVLSIAFRFVRAALRRLNRPPWANHFCFGESGNGEWCFRGGENSVCGYCKEPLIEKGKQ